MKATVILRDVSRIALVATVTLLVACGNKPPEPTAAGPMPAMPADHPPMTAAAAAVSTLAPETVMARVGKDVVTAGDVTDALAAMPGPDRLEYTTTPMIRELVESLADRRLMAATARKEGLDTDPVMKEMLAGPPGAAAIAPDEMLAGVWLETELAKSPAPTEADVAAYYAAHRAEFNTPARVRVTRIVASDQASAERARGELTRGATLEQMQAGKSSITVEELWLQDVPKKPELVSVALGLEPGKVSPVLPAASGYAVLRAEEHAPARARALDEVRPGIEATLQDQVRQAGAAALRKRLRKDVPVEIVEAAVSSYLAPAPGAS